MKIFVHVKRHQLQPLPNEHQPSIDAYIVEVTREESVATPGPSGIWPEFFTRPKVEAFIRGVRAAASMYNNYDIEEKWDAQ